MPANRLNIIKIEECKVKQQVIFIPKHANGDVTHMHCSLGVITEIGERFATVKLDNELEPEECEPEFLIEHN